MINTTPTKALDEPFSEVIFSSGELIIAQCYKEAKVPQKDAISTIQGSIVKVISSYDNSHIAFGLVAKINNSSLDNIHKPSALGLRQEELIQLQPQVYDLLRKELEICLFAHLDKKGQITNYPPPKPLTIHDFVYIANEEELLKLTNDLSNLIGIIKKNNLKPDLLLEPISQGYKLRNNNYSYLVKTSQYLASTFSDDIEPLIQVLKRISEISKNKTCN